MTAWEEIQMDWAENTEKNNLSGILLWDLSAAFDTLDVDIFCEKIVLYQGAYISLQPRRPHLRQPQLGNDTRIKKTENFDTNVTVKTDEIVNN